MDNSDPYLAGGRHRDPATGEPVGLRQDVLGHVRHEVTREEARARIDADAMPAPGVDVLPLDTYEQRREEARAAAIEHEVDLMTTDRWGEPVHEQRLALCTDGFYVEARELAVYEVAPEATHRRDARVYRGDITGIRHPDAVFIARSRTDLARTLSALERVLELLGDEDQVVDREDIALAIAAELAP